MDKKIKIIIADDNRNLCQMLQNFLQEQEDLQVVGIANNGIEAWELIQTQEPDLLIIDLVMPNLDGLGVFRKNSCPDNPSAAQGDYADSLWAGIPDSSGHDAGSRLFYPETL